VPQAESRTSWERTKSGRKSCLEYTAYTLKGSQRLNQQENRLETLRKELQQLEARGSSGQAALDKMIEMLAIDVTVR
jgi:hypothetical protein